MRHFPRDKQQKFSFSFAKYFAENSDDSESSSVDYEDFYETSSIRIVPDEDKETSTNNDYNWESTTHSENGESVNLSRCVL